MTAISGPPTSPAPTAEAAFLRGVGRRAGLLARLQCGDAGRGAEAVAAAAREFTGLAPGLPMEQWPVRYWGLLLAAPGLRSPAVRQAWPPSLAWLGGLAPPSRAVLLLRLVARLEVDEVAAVLDVPAGAVQSSLRGAVPRHADGSHDAATWQARQAALREALDAVPAPAQPMPENTTSPDPGLSQRRTRLMLWAAFAASVVALAASFLLPLRLPLRQPPASGDAGPVEAVPLPPYQAPALARDPDLALLAHPDLEQLAAAADATLVRDLGFHSWHAARLFEQRDSGVEGTGDAD